MVRAGPWPLKNSLVSPPHIILFPVDCSCSEKGQNCGLDAVLIIGKKNTEEDVDWMRRKENPVVKEPVYKRIHILIIGLLFILENI